MRALTLSALIVVLAVLAACRPDYPPGSVSDPHYAPPAAPDARYAPPAVQDPHYAPASGPPRSLAAPPPPPPPVEVPSPQ